MRLTYDPTANASSIYVRQGEWDNTLPFDVDNVSLNIDVDADGYVLQLEVLHVSELLALVGKYGGELVIPEHIADTEAFNIMELFPKYKDNF